MQSAQRELIFPVQADNRLFSTICSTLLFTFLSLGCIWWIVLAKKLGLLDQEIKSIVIVGALDFLGLILNGWSIARILRRRLASPPVYQVSHEGISFPSPASWLSYEGIYFPVLIQWDEIETLFLYTVPNGVPAIGIVLRSYEALFARSLQEHSPGAFRRYFINLNSRILRGNAGYTAHVHIPQRKLSLSIEEFLTEIRTHFTAELLEHHVTILGWRNEDASSLL